MKAYKSVFKYSKLIAEKTGREDNVDINLIVNNWFDISCGCLISDHSKNLQNSWSSDYFWSIGHSYHMMWGWTVSIIASVCDPGFSFLSDVRKWDENFNRLETERKEGFFERSLIPMPPLGARAIFEGQARFCQLQYLYSVSGQKLSFPQFAKVGMMEDLYIEAFEVFLQVLGEKWPENSYDPLVALFLLICDLAINPTDGFPLDVVYYETFIISNDPRTRFFMLCQVVAHGYPALKKWIILYSKKEYLEVSKVLSRKIVCFSLHKSMCKINEWIEREPFIQHLLEEKRLFQYDSGNMAARLFFSKYLSFQQDKYRYLHFFCWPGVGMTDQNMTDIPMEKKLALDECHRLSVQDTADAPLLPEVWAEIVQKIEGRTLVAHNKGFDETHLIGCHEHYGISYLNYTFGYTLWVLRRRLSELYEHQFYTVSAYVGFDLDIHHYPFVDAEACARRAIEFL